MSKQKFMRGKMIELTLIPYPLEGEYRERLIELGEKAVAARFLASAGCFANAILDTEEGKELYAFEDALRKRVGVEWCRQEFLPL